MSKHTLLGKQVVFSEAEDRSALYVYRTVQAMKAAESEFLTWYDNSKNITAVLSNYMSEVKSLIAKHANNPLFEELVSFKIYDIGRPEYDNSCLTLQDAIPAYNKAVDAFNDIEYELEEEKEYRADRKADRGRFVGGGFGVSGAAKGIATAGALNIATGAAHSVVNAIGNAASEGNANAKKAVLYKDAKAYLCEALTDCINRAFCEHISIINNRIPKHIYANFDQSKSNALLESAKKVIAERTELLVSAFVQCPWNYDLYSYIFATFPQERRNVLDIAKQYHVDLTNDVEALLGAEYTDEAQKSEAAAQRAKQKILKIMKELGISESKTLNALEQDCISRICSRLANATEAECEEFRNKVLAYDALQKNKEPFLDEIQRRIESIWSAEDGVIFDNFLLRTNILDDAEVKKGIEYIKSHGRTEGKNVYLHLFGEINRRNIAKARRYAPLTGTGIVKCVLRNIGYILMGIGCFICVVSGFESNFSLIPFWGGVLIAIILGVHKSAWNKLTLKGKVINPILIMSKQEYQDAVMQTAAKKQS